MGSLEIARSLCESRRLVLVPSGEKGPRQKAWHKDRVTVEQFDRAFANQPQPNVGIILGDVVDIECDGPQAEIDLQELFDGNIPTTPMWASARGPHRLFLGDERLAGLDVAVIKWKSVEVRLGGNKAAQSLIPPSTTDGFERTWIVSPLDCEPTKLPDSVVEKLLKAVTEKQKPRSSAGKSSDKKSPGDDFCESMPWSEILKDHYIHFGSDGEKDQWQRIGGDGVTATTGCTSKAGRDLFYNFSGNDPNFEEGKSYNKFGVYAILFHGGDFRAAAAELAKQGFGDAADPAKGSASAKLIAIGETAELFHTPEGDAYATVPVGDHQETYRIEAKEFKRWLEHCYYQSTGKAAAQKAMTEAIGVLAAKARFDGLEFEVHTRIAHVDDVIYLDLCNERWDVVLITAQGWEVIECPPTVKFRRPRGMLKLPYPEYDSNIDELREFVNLDDRSWILFVASLVGAFAKGPYVIGLILSGHGSGKTTTMRHGRQIFDPNMADVRAAPQDVERLMLAATNGASVCIDNADNVQNWLASALCRISTGGGFGTRELYTNDGEHLFNVMRPVWITGITDLTEREDFLSRCLILRCPTLTESKRRDEATLIAEFERKRPGILGALLTAVSTALCKLPEVKVERLPRMADFYKWIVAAEEGLGWEKGTFEKAFAASQDEINSIALDNPVADAIRKFMQLQSTWTGTSQNLLDALTQLVGTPPAEWPKAPHVLSSKLNRLKNDLAGVGINISQHRREWTISA